MQLARELGHVHEQALLARPQQLPQAMLEVGVVVALQRADHAAQVLHQLVAFGLAQRRVHYAVSDNRWKILSSFSFSVIAVNGLMM